MFDNPDAKPHQVAFQYHRKLALWVFFGVLVACGAAAFLTLQYSATAVVALNPVAAANPDGQPPSAVQIAWSFLPDRRIAALIEQFHLDSGITQLLAEGQTFTYIRSRISLHQVGSADSVPREIAVSFRGPDRSTVIDLTNALAQTLVAEKGAEKREISPQGTNPAIATELEKSRRALQLLSEGQNTDALKGEMQKHLKLDGELRKEEREIEFKLSMLEQQLQQEELAASKARAQPPRPPLPNPARIAPEQQVTEAAIRLAQLRQRYTEEYPDVVEAKNALAALEANLSRIPRYIPAPPLPQTARASVSPTEEARVAAEKAALQDSQTDLETKIQKNRGETEALRQRIADGKSFAEDYALEQNHYNALLKAQQTGFVIRTGGAPLFMIVQSATTADPDGLALKPLFWILSLLVALLAALIAVYLARQLDPMIEEDTASKSFHSN